MGQDADRSERHRLRASHRTKQLQERIDELAQRRREIDVNVAEARGSGAEQVLLARENLQRARLAAVDAAEFAADAHEAAADAHDHAAALNDQLAAIEGGTAGADHTLRAAEHRRAARQDRDAARAERAGRGDRTDPATERGAEP